MKPVLALAALAIIFGGAALLARSREGEVSAPRVDDAKIAALLEDRTQPWYKGHAVPKPLNVSVVYTAPELMGAFKNPPSMTPVLPVDVAYALTSGARKVPEGHPFHGRTARLVDMRLKSLHLVERIPGSVSAPLSTIATALKSGSLEGIRKSDLIILHGEAYPHFDAPHLFRSAGYEAVYCLEGGLDLWKSRGFPVESKPELAGLMAQLKSEAPVSATSVPKPMLDPENIGPGGLKTVIDLGLRPLIVFVGDDATFKAGRIPGAVHIPQSDVVKRLETEPRDRLIVLYCGCCEGVARGLSGFALEQLRGLGFTRLLHLEGHLKGWKDGGFPLEYD